MAVDYLSAMNVGSGLNVTQIVDALVDAEKAPREAQISAKIEEKTVSISALAEEIIIGILEIFFKRLNKSNPSISGSIKSKIIIT